ncbi:MAG: Mannitol dehydrogenase, C-terminal domain protein, partial [Marmoricola sp.]|nr:Mannitol dehydrogenase, C-terminal domain protein [Marmoricola sp.]
MADRGCHVMQRLSLQTLSQVPGIMRPHIDASELGVGIVHLGPGAFHRAHQAAFTEDALADSPGDWGICGVTQRSATVVEQLRPQDGLYSLVERSATSSDVRVMGVLREVLSAQKEPAVVIQRIAAPTTRIVSLTVTEKGYRSDILTGEIRRSDPHIRSDVDGGPPQTVLGQLVRGLQARRLAQSGPVTILCCDNLSGSGKTLRSLVEQFCMLLEPSERAGLNTWIHENVAFPQSMVDRIVPATTAEDLDEVRGRLGLDDHGAVVTETFRQWVIEDQFPAGRPAWETAGAIFTDDVTPYETLKVRLLNGSHSTLAYLGALKGIRLVADVMIHPELAECARRLMDDDVTPTLVIPEGFDIASYKASVLERFADPSIRHRTAQVAMDGSQKLPSRLLATIYERYAAGAEPRWACLGVAAWMR